MKCSLVILISFLFIVTVFNTAKAEIVVPDGFVARKILNQLDGQSPRLEAISNPEYGFGVIAGFMNNGILTVLHLSNGSIQVLATKYGFPSNTVVKDLRFDKSGLFNNKLFISIYIDANGDGDSEQTRIFQISQGGSFTEKISIGSVSDPLGFKMAFTDGSMGYLPGLYLEDTHVGGGTSLYHFDCENNLTKLSQNLVPSGRTDMDIQGMQFDQTGVYNYHLLMADSDDNDELTVIYRLLPNMTWEELSPPVNRNERHYKDMVICSGGNFGPNLYTTDSISNTIMTVDPDGTHTVFASGFFQITSVTTSGDGNTMFVSDASGIYRINPEDNSIGPKLLMREPMVKDGVYTGGDGVDSSRILWSEEILFDQNDITITNEAGAPVPFSAIGSQTQFMVITFGRTLLNDKYTITIKDSVVSSSAYAPIDGDNDGLAGGDAVFTMEHRKRSDFDNDNDVDGEDLETFAAEFNWIR